MAERSRYFETAELMDDAFLELLKEKDIEFITVKEICSRAGVSRSTFYLHYESIADLLEESLELVLKRFLARFDEDEQRLFFEDLHSRPKDDLYLMTPRQLMPYLEFVRDNREIFSAIVKNSESLRLSEIYSLLETHVIHPILERFDVPREDRPYLMAFYLNGLMAIVGEWVRKDCSTSIDRIAAIMQQCCRLP